VSRPPKTADDEKGVRKMSNVLDLYDQTYITFERAAEVTCALQCVWVYNRAIDIDGLRQFHRHLQQGRLSRRVERSPLPFGRHRWVAATVQSDLEIVETPRAREDFDAWLGEQANTPLDGMEADPGPKASGCKWTWVAAYE
jgi:diacylglycerol O-acyltransferase / wax synthase